MFDFSLDLCAPATPVAELGRAAATIGPREWVGQWPDDRQVCVAGRAALERLSTRPRGRGVYHERGMAVWQPTLGVGLSYFLGL